MKKINSVHNSTIKEALKLHKKSGIVDQNKFLVPHQRLIQSALTNQYNIEMIFALDSAYTEASQLGQAIIVSPAIMNRLAPNYTKCNMVGVINIKDQIINFDTNVLLLDHIQDPGNLGTLIRSALSFGFTNIVLVNNCTNIYSWRVVLASQGAVFGCNIQICNSQEKILKTLTAYKAKQYIVVGTSSKQPSTFDKSIRLKPKNKIVLCLGNEGVGLSEFIINNTTHNWWIPLNKQAESLNVAIAGSLLMYLYKNNL